MEDQLVRQRVLNIEESFIVQAPAGSGKTTVLLSRFLKTLHAVKNPTRILCMTFTKKAAQEMKDRITNAFQYPEESGILKPLIQAILDDPNIPDSRQLQQQLQILNIDQFAQHVVEKAPQYTQNLSSYQLSPIEPLLKEAIQNSLTSQKYKAQWHCVFKLFDNQFWYIQKSFIALFESSEQWMGFIFKTPKSFSVLQDNLQHWFKNRSAQLGCRFKKIGFNQTHWNAILQAQQQHPDPKIHNADLPKTLPQTTNYLAYKTLACLFLTSKKEVRKRWNKTNGVLPEQKELKQMLLEITTLFSTQTIQTALKEYASFPSFKEILHEEEYETLTAIQTLLLDLYAHLEVVMNETQHTHFGKITHTATQVLRNQYISYFHHHIQHLLMDEFQDTSITQWEFIKALLEPWEQTAEKSIFLVGDPMQSIYEFRQAEPHLFAQGMRKKLLKNWNLQPVHLVCNFRSSKQLVEHNNHVFESYFGKQNDTLLATVPFFSARATHTMHDSQVRYYELNATNSLETLRNIFHNLPREHAHKTSILCLTNKHVQEVSALLTQLNIDHKAHSRSVDKYVQQFVVVLNALSNPQNTLAWSGLLRCAWVGLNLTDIQVIFNTVATNTLLKWHNAINHLTEDGKQRSAVLLPILQFLTQRFLTLPSAQWVSLCLNTLPTHHINESIKIHLIEYAQKNTVDWLKFEDDLKQHHTSSAVIDTEHINVLTVHGAKGLEFEHVILFLNKLKKPPATHTPLNWLFDYENETFLMSHYSKIKKNECYQYIQAITHQKKQLEQLRLLYVAYTRAKRHLFILEDEKHLSNNTHHQKIDENKREQPSDNTVLERLNLEHFSTPIPVQETGHYAPLKFSVKQHNQKKIGEIIHQHLEHWGTEKKITLPSKEHIQQHVAQYAVSHEYRSDAVKNILRCLKNLSLNSTVQWIINHPNAYYEQTFFLQEKQLRLDCLLVEDKKCWVIDYKNTLTEFLTLSDVQQQFQAQLMNYAQAVHDRFKLPVEVGIYLTQTQQFFHWLY